MFRDFGGCVNMENVTQSISELFRGRGKCPFLWVQPFCLYEFYFAVVKVCREESTLSCLWTVLESEYSYTNMVSDDCILKQIWKMNERQDLHSAECSTVDESNSWAKLFQRRGLSKVKTSCPSCGWSCVFNHCGCTFVPVILLQNDSNTKKIKTTTSIPLLVNKTNMNPKYCIALNIIKANAFHWLEDFHGI